MRTLRTVLSVAAVGLVAAACATTPTAPPRPPIPPPPPPTPREEFSWSQQPGANALVGNIVYRPAAGQTWGCAGQSVALMPETSYSRGRILTLYGSAERALRTVEQVRTVSAANPGEDYSEFVRSTTCDAQDTFAFTNLPSGAYYIIARVRQTAPATTDPGLVIMQRIELRGGQPIRVVLPQAPPNLPARR